MTWKVEQLAARLPLSIPYRLTSVFCWQTAWHAIASAFSFLTQALSTFPFIPWPDLTRQGRSSIFEANTAYVDYYCKTVVHEVRRENMAYETGTGAIHSVCGLLTLLKTGDNKMQISDSSPYGISSTFMNKLIVFCILRMSKIVLEYYTCK
jgi:hypothetical protein